MKNKRGLSGVISMILMVVLTLIAVGIVWGVVNNIINSKTKGAECINIFDKVLINNYYTCYDQASDELNIAVEIKNIDIDEVLVAIYGESSSVTFNIPSSGYSWVKPYNGDYNDALTLPSENSASTFTIDVSGAGITTPSIIKISPTIGDYQCEVSDTILNIDAC